MTVDEPIRRLSGDLAADPGFLAGCVLDLRPGPEFRAAHLAGSVNHPVETPPGGDFGGAFWEGALPSIFLPPRHRPLLVVAADQACARACAEALAGRGRPRVSYFAGAIPAELIAAGPGRPHLWEPDPWLVRHEGLLPPPAVGPVLDLGCGSGRSAVWLALHGYRVTGIDRQDEALAMGRTLAARHGVRVDFRAGDLRDPAAIPPGPWSVVVNFRFLHRPLLEGLAGLVMPQGVALVRTFRDAPGYEGHPQRRHRLGRAELPILLRGGDWRILAHSEDFDADGRPAAGIVVRRADRP